MKKLADEGTTMIVVTHEIEFAKKVANRVVLMQDGVIVEENDPVSFFENPQEEKTKQFLQHTSWTPDGKEVIL